MKFSELNDIVKENAREDIVEELYPDYIQQPMNDELTKELKNITGVSGLKAYIDFESDASYDPTMFFGSLTAKDIKNLPFGDLINDDTAVINLDMLNDEELDIHIDGDVEYTKEEMDAIENAISEWYFDVCDKLQTYSNEIISYFYSDEFIDEVFSDFDFTEEGYLEDKYLI